MAIAGLHSASVLSSSFLRESQSSRQNGDERRPSTRASFLLQMWRDLEDEHVVSRVQDGYSEMLHRRRNDRLLANISRASTPQNHSTEQEGISEGRGISQNVDDLLSCDLRGTDHEDDHSDDSGEVERDRIQGNYQEWMNCSRREQASNAFQRNNHSREKWLVETAQEGMRIIRGSTQINGEQVGACRESREEQETEMGGQMGRVLDGLVVNQNRDWTEHIRRGNRRLCGRQVLHDMLDKAVMERRNELQSLVMYRAVSQFAHRNRIQSLLRGRFLRNDRIVEDKRPNSLAASEIGLLRQRLTVSGLREGFVSRVEHSGNSQVSRSYSDTSSNSDISGNADDQSVTDSCRVVLDDFHELSLPNNQESDSCGLRDGRSGLEGNSVENISSPESYTHAEVWHEQDSEHGAKDWLPSSSVEFVEVSDGTRQNVDGNWQETSSIVWSEETLQNEGGLGHPQEAGQVLYEESGPTDWLPSISVEFVERSDLTVQHSHSHLRVANQVLYQQFEPISEVSTANVSLDHAGIVEGNTTGYMNWHEFAARVDEREEEQVQQNEDTDWQGARIEYNEWRNGLGGDMDANQHERSGNEWSQEFSVSHGREEDYMEESPGVWHEDGSFQEAVQNWLEEPSDQQDVPIGRIDMFDFHDDDDDNATGTELRELLSRRRVSNLLCSGFRARLDHLIQSRVDRQSQSPIDRDPHRALPIPSGEQHSEQHSRDQNGNEGVGSGSPSLDLPLLSIPVQSIWDSDSQNDTWQQHDMRLQLGVDWEIINGMRIDMARLHQRMNSMQSMLEACMDMQLQLQRSIRQEVSAALDRSATSPGDCTRHFVDDGAQWNHMRRGFCCVCGDNKIDSLLYRCGHMCACSECANSLVESGGKCPMCMAPVVEVIRAFSIE